MTPTLRMDGSIKIGFSGDWTNKAIKQEISRISPIWESNDGVKVLHVWKLKYLLKNSGLQ